MGILPNALVAPEFMGYNLFSIWLNPHDKQKLIKALCNFTQISSDWLFLTGDYPLTQKKRTTVYGLNGRRGERIINQRT